MFRHHRVHSVVVVCFPPPLKAGFPSPILFPVARMEWWTDLWLKEGFANWIMYLATDFLFPDWDIWIYFVMMDLGRALSLDSSVTCWAKLLASLFPPCSSSECGCFVLQFVILSLTRGLTSGVDSCAQVGEYSSDRGVCGKSRRCGGNFRWDLLLEGLLSHSHAQSFYWAGSA